MISARRSIDSYSKTIFSSILQWVQTLEIEYQPVMIDELFNGVALFQILQSIDKQFWSHLDLNSNPKTDREIIKNFKVITTGIERYYQQRLDSSISCQVLDIQKMLESRDKSTLLELFELVMGIVVNCEEKQTFIAGIMDLDEATQEDLQKLIEQSLQRLSIEMSEASSQQTDQTSHQELERLEKEKKLLRDKILEVEMDLKKAQYESKSKDRTIKELENRINTISTYAEQKGEHQRFDMQALQGLSQLEAQLKFKENEIQQLKAEMDGSAQRYKQQAKELKEELLIYKERVMKQQKADAQMEIYRQKLDELEELRSKVNDLEDEKLKLEMDNKTYKIQLNDFDQYKQTIDYLKDEIKKTKEEKHFLELSSDKQKSDLKEVQNQYNKLEKKYKVIEEKYSQILEQFEVNQSKLSAYEQFGGNSMKNFNNDLLELSMMSQRQPDDLEDRIKELEQENATLKMKNKDELNVKLLQIEQQLEDQKREKRKLEHQIELNENRINSLEEENDFLKTQAVSESQAMQSDFTKDLQKAQLERDHNLNKILKLQKKLEKKEDQLKQALQLKEEKVKLEEELRGLYKEKSSEKDLYLKLKEENIKMVSQLSDFEYKIKTLSQDNQKLENALSKMQMDSSKTTSADIEQSLKFLTLEKERDTLKWDQERKEYQNKIQQIEELIKTKNIELNSKEDFVRRRVENELRNLEQSYEEQIQQLKDDLDQKKNEITFLKEQKQEIQMKQHRTNELISSQFHNLGLAHFSQQRKGGRTWLENQRNKVYNHGYDYIFNPN